MTFGVMTLCILKYPHNDTKHNDIEHNDTKQTDIQHNDTQHEGLTCDTQHT